MTDPPLTPDDEPGQAPHQREPAPSGPGAADDCARTPPPRRHPSDAGCLRIVIVLWCFWLLGAWAMAWLSDTSVPRVRWMMFAGSFGLMLVWPAFRLSERAPGSRPGQHAASPVFLDWLAMVLVYQAVVWSLHLIAYWPISRGLWLDAAVLAWSLLSALIVAAARRWPNAAARTLGMALCIALVFAEPVLLWLAHFTGHEGWAMRLSPIQTLWELTEPPDGSGVGPWGQQIVAVAIAAAAGWAALGLWAIGERLALRKGRAA